MVDSSSAGKRQRLYSGSFSIFVYVWNLEGLSAVSPFSGSSDQREEQHQYPTLLERNIALGLPIQGKDLMVFHFQSVGEREAADLETAVASVLKGKYGELDYVKIRGLRLGGLHSVVFVLTKFTKIVSRIDGLEVKEGRGSFGG